MSNRPPDVWGFEEVAETKPRFKEGERVVVQSHPSLPARFGQVKWRRWECGNRCWGYSVALDAGGGTMAVESCLTPEGSDD